MARTGSRKLKVTVPSDTEIVLTRELDAAPHLVYEAMTKPEYVRRWWNCMEGHTMPVCEIDLRVGGKWRFVMLDQQGTEHGFHGVYREIVAPVRIVQTETYEPFPDAEVLVTVTLEARDGRTLLTSRTQCPDKQTRDNIIASGMEYGADLAYDRLEEVARELLGRLDSQGTVEVGKLGYRES